MRGTGIQFGQQEARLAAALFGAHNGGGRQATLRGAFRICLCRRQHLREGRMLRQMLVPGRGPGSDGDPVKQQHHEECVQHQSPLPLNGGHVQGDWNRGLPDGERKQSRLDHGQRIGGGLPLQPQPIERRLVGCIVEYLEKLGPPQVEQELGEQLERVWKLERRWVVALPRPETLAQRNHTAIEPAHNIYALLGRRLERREACHSSCCRALIESVCQLSVAS
mmetsp:Transcript_12641/g.38028  ORF Transcript_12641/g.38028 Transcript_12641/m.38028 type:complete len:222 (-) Transcript_12641:866-1531(-)